MRAEAGRGSRKARRRRAFLADARRRIQPLDAELARVHAQVEVDYSNRSMGAGEGAGSTVEALLDEERPRTLVVLVPFRVQVPSAGTKNTGV